MQLSFKYFLSRENESLRENVGLRRDKNQENSYLRNSYREKFGLREKSVV